jgi:hypothetical protein
MYTLPSAGTTLLAQETAVKHRITLLPSSRSHYQREEQRNAISKIFWAHYRLIGLCEILQFTNMGVTIPATLQFIKHLLAHRPNKPIPQFRALVVSRLVNKLHTLLKTLKAAKRHKWRYTSVQHQMWVWEHHSNAYSDCSLLWCDADMYKCFQGTYCLHHNA